MEHDDYKALKKQYGSTEQVQKVSHSLQDTRKRLGAETNIFVKYVSTGITKEKAGRVFEKIFFQRRQRSNKKLYNQAMKDDGRHHMSPYGNMSSGEDLAETIRLVTLAPNDPRREQFKQENPNRFDAGITLLQNAGADIQ